MQSESEDQSIDHARSYGPLGTNKGGSDRGCKWVAMEKAKREGSVPQLVCILGERDGAYVHAHVHMCTQAEMGLCSRGSNHVASRFV